MLQRVTEKRLAEAHRRVLHGVCHCFCATRTYVAWKHVSRTSNLYPDTCMSTDTCFQIQVARPGYVLIVSRRHNYYSFMSRSTCIPLYPETDGRQTGDNFVASTRNMLTVTSGYKWTQLVSSNIWCKRGLTVDVVRIGNDKYYVLLL